MGTCTCAGQGKGCVSFILSRLLARLPPYTWSSATTSVASRHRSGASIRWPPGVSVELEGVVTTTDRHHHG